jgi:Zn-finger nucleic acid-binding protein
MLETAKPEALIKARKTYIKPDKAPTASHIDCPVCSQRMNRKDVGGPSESHIDVCDRHGIWFDKDEPPFVMAFALESGVNPVGKRKKGALLMQNLDLFISGMNASLIGAAIELGAKLLGEAKKRMRRG